MESPCQVKGCKVNKKSAKQVIHDDRLYGRDNPNINNEENNDESKSSINSSHKKYAKDGSGTAATNAVPSPGIVNANHNSNNNSSNNSSFNNKNNASGNGNGHGNGIIVTNGKTNYNSGGGGGGGGGTGHGKTTKTDVSYNKAVINGKMTTGEVIAHNKSRGDNASTTNHLSSYEKHTYNSKVNNSSNSSSNSSNSSNSNSSNNSNNSSSNSSGNEGLNNKVVSRSGESLANTENTNETSESGNNNNNNNNNSRNNDIAKSKASESESQQRRAVLSYEQVCRLNDVMNEVVSIHGRGNFPTLEVRLRDLVTIVKDKLEADPSNGGAGMKVRDIRLNGGAASHVLATESQPYNDLDLIFGVELTSGRNYDKVKAAVLGSLFELLPEGVSRKRITTCSLKEAYVSKMVKVNNDGDRWSLISLGNSRGHRNVELKFVDTMRRQFEFSVDSFQIVLDSLLLFHECSKVQMSENLYPTIVGESVYGDFHEALYHLQKKLISTRHPEEIRGGGLLKYCNLLVKMYKAAQPDYIKTLERYMCSRFFIDFPDIGQQRTKLENYLWNHFVGPEEETLKYQYLTLLHNVVEESTVCLMGHERRQTLALIESLAYQVLCQEQQRLTNHQTAPTAYVYANGYYYAPVIPTACYTCTCNSWMACSS